MDLRSVSAKIIHAAIHSALPELSYRLFPKIGEKFKGILQNERIIEMIFLQLSNLPILYFLF